MIPTRRRPLAALATAVLALSGCDADANGTDAVDTIPASTETAATPASTEPTTASPSPDSAPTPATMTPVEPTSVEPALGEEPPLRDDAVSGSGCAPDAEVLPAGWWYGFIEAPPRSTLQFDLACYYIGAAGEAQAASAGEPMTNDYYVVNESSKIRAVPVAGDATASCVLVVPRVESVECAPHQVVGAFAVWLRVEQSGEITRIVEQFAP